MNDITKTTELDTCGCCEADLLEELTHENPPGQSALGYRIGTHSAFLRRMLVRLPRQRIPDGDNQGTRPLADLTARASDDPAIALLDAWAVVTDVLTFYQERIANEGFLHTATERRSVLELARAIGYELSPGVAAGTYLAFTVDDAEETPDEVTVSSGTQVQSIPSEQGELPQTFETSEELAAKAGWNKLRPRMTRPQVVTTAATELYLKGTGLDLEPGDLLLLVARDAGGQVTAAVPRRIHSVKEDLESSRTFVKFQTDAGSAVASEVLVGATAGTTGFGEAAAAPGADFGVGGTAFELGSVEFNAGNVGNLILGQTLTESELQATLRMNRWREDDVLDHVSRISVPAEEAAEVYAMREKAGIFGHNAPYYESLPDEKIGSGNAYPHDWDDPDWEIWKDSLTGEYYEDADVYLERGVAGIVEDSWAILERPKDQYVAYQINAVADTSLTGFGISGKTTGLELADTAGNALDETNKPDEFKVRKTAAHVKSEPLTLAKLLITDELEAGDTALTLDGMVLGLQEGQAVALTGEQADAEGVERSEILFLDRITHSGGYTTLQFEQGLQYGYVRDTVTLNANVVRATHGETVLEEVLGGGDGSQTNQRFRLKKPPLTYVSAATPSGAESTLSVRVNDVLWEEVASLYGLDGDSRSYIVRIDNEARASVIFGDGKRGARLPTGQENVVAGYRSGIGSDGEVGADSLTLLKTRPLGIREVTNPLVSSGAADPETLDDARDNAPLTVLTLDRIVSLQDFEDFARGFAGIGKAQAVALWDGETRLVHITIADANGDEVESTSDLYANLRDAINAARDPLQEVRIGSFQPLFFNVGAKVLIDPAYQWEDVASEIEAALQEAFAFERRAFGQPVTAADAVNVIHEVDGVIAVDLDELHLVTRSGAPQGAMLASVLPAQTVRLDPTTNEILLAQLLLINESGITLTEMTS